MNKEIRSFVIRGSRLKDSRKELINDNPLGLLIKNQQDNLLSFNEIFGNDNPVAIEIGFGMGDSPYYFAQNHQEYNLLAIEVHPPGVARLYWLLQEGGIKNVRIAQADCISVLSKWIADNSLQRCSIFFPDPWPKKKHHKRRLINLNFLKLLASKLKVGATIFIATDWSDYAYQIREVVLQLPSLKLEAATPDGFSTRCTDRPITAFEKKALAKSHTIYDFAITKIATLTGEKDD